MEVVNLDEVARMNSQSREHAAYPSRVVVVGLDGATLDVIEPWAAAGRLPNLARLMAEGATARLRSVTPPISGPAWSSFATGVDPGRHGIYDFMALRHTPRPYTLVTHTRPPLELPTLWRQLSQAGRRVCVLNVPLTYPPEPVNGALISGLMTPPQAHDAFYPPGLQASLRQAVPDYTIQPDTIFFAPGREAALLAATQAMTDMRRRATLYLLEKEAWEFFMVVFMATDIIQHATWRFWDTTHRDHPADAPPGLRHAILTTYQQVDAALGEIMARLDDATTLIVMSDHGFGPLERYLHLNTWLLQHGWLQLRPRPFSARLKYALFRAGLTPITLSRWLNGLGQMQRATRRVRRQRAQTRSWLNRLFLSFDDVDWPRTRAYAVGNMGAVYLPVQGREPQGHILPGAAYAATRQELREALLGLRDPADGRPLLAHVHLREEVYHGPYLSGAPDLICEPADWRTLPLGMLPFPSPRWLEPAFDRSGGHRPEGILIVRGPGVKAGYCSRFHGSDEPAAHITDLAPTILGLLGTPAPTGLDGRFLAELFSDPPALTWTDAPAQPAPAAHGPLSEAEQAALQQRLRDLGYVA